MVTERSTRWMDAVAKRLEQLDVADTIGELRQQIDELIRRLAESEGSGAGESQDSQHGSSEPLGLEEEIESLGKKVEAASDMLAELADVLEAQTERIETIEQQLGDPDAEPDLPMFRMEPKEAEASGLREFLSERFARVEERMDRIEHSVGEVRTRTDERDRHVRDLEDRLLILVDSAGQRARDTAPPTNDGAAPPHDGTAAGRQPEACPPGPLPEQTSERETALDRGGECSAVASRGNEPPATGQEDQTGQLQAPPDAAASARSRLQELEEIVEREVRLQPSPTSEQQGQNGVRLRKARPTVMVVDDSADARTILSIYLSKTGYQVVTACSAEDCLAKLLYHDVDAIVLDASMPGADGGHVCRTLREDPAYVGRRDLPVIVYTGYPEDFDRKAIQPWSATEYVVKGGDMLPLITALVRHTKAAS